MTSLIHVVLDKSGSMASSVEPTLAGFNEFLGNMKREVSDAKFGLTLFDTAYEERFVGEPIENVPELIRAGYVPGGNTALYDAIGRAIRAIEALPEKPDKVVIAIITDGQENSSHEFTQKDIFDLISWHTNEGKGWQFTFLGADQDAYAASMDMGIAASATMNYGKSMAGTRAMTASLSHSTSSYLRGESGGVSYSNEQKEEVESHAGTPVKP